MKRLIRKMRINVNLTICLSVFWLIFALLFLYEPADHFNFLRFAQQFVAMGVLPLVVFWGTWWVVNGEKKDKARN